MEVPIVRDAELTDFEVYDLREDRAEQQNLAATRPDLKERLVSELNTRYRELVSSSHVWTPVETD